MGEISRSRRGRWIGGLALGAIALVWLLVRERNAADTSTSVADEGRDPTAARPHVAAARATSAVVTAPIAGMVQTPEGEPIAAALVCASPAGATVKFRGRRPQPSLAGLLGTVCEPSGNDGRFSIAGGRGRFTLRAASPGRRPGPEEALAVDAAPGLAIAPVTIVLEAGGARVRGRVVDRFGGPIEDALLTSDDGGLALSDVEGAFVLPVADERPIVVAWRPGYVAQGRPILAPMDDLVLTLIPESVIEGRVIDQEGHTVAGIDVQTGRDLQEVTTTDDRGHFRLTGLRPGIVQLRAVDDDHDGSSAPLQLGVGVTVEGIDIRTEVSLAPQWKVVDARSHEACAGATVSLHGEAAQAPTELTADAAGSLRLVDVPPGLYNAKVRCPGHLGVREEFLVEPRERRTIALEPGLTIAGIVRDAHGEPTADVVVYLRGGDEGSARPDRHGRFSIGEARPGPVTLAARGLRSVAAEEAVLELDLRGDRDDLVLTMPASGELLGRVVDEHDTPVGGVQVLLRLAAGGPARTLVSGEDGTFTAFPAPGLYVVDVSWRRGNPDLHAPGQPLEVLASGPTRVTLRMPPRPSYRAHGRVVDEGGDPLADIAVSIQGDETLTDAEGRFSIPDLLEPDAVIALSASDGASAILRDLDLRGDGDLELVLATNTVVCGEVRGLEPGVGFRVERRRFPAGAGDFCLPGIPRGRRTFTAEQGDRSGTVENEVGDPPPKVILTLAPPAGPITGRVVDTEGAPARVGVWLMRGDGRLIASTSTDEAGGFGFVRAPAGPTTLRVMRAGTTPPVELDLKAGVPLEGVEIVVPAPSAK